MPDNVKMIALSRFFLHEGDAERLRVGQEFVTTEENAADLVTVQRAERAPVSAADVAKTRPYRTRNMRSEH